MLSRYPLVDRVTSLTSQNTARQQIYTCVLADAGKKWFHLLKGVREVWQTQNQSREIRRSNAYQKVWSARSHSGMWNIYHALLWQRNLLWRTPTWRDINEPNYASKVHIYLPFSVLCAFNCLHFGRAPRGFIECSQPQQGVKVHSSILK
jgi:hypothetical protein